MPVTRGLSYKLAAVQQIFSKPRLSTHDFHALFGSAYELVSYAAKVLNRKLAGRDAYSVVGPLARRGLVLDSLWGICYVVGTALHKGQWWDKLMAKITVPTAVDQLGVRKGYGHARLALVKRLVSAIDVCRTGKRPPPQELVEIKRAIFCGPVVHRDFTSPMWEPWRQDDKDLPGSL